MQQEVYHPNAYLTSFRNVKQGLRARTIVLNALEKNAVKSKKIVELTGLTYAVVIHHLKLLEKHDLIIRKGKKPFVWSLTGLGQKRLG